MYNMYRSYHTQKVGELILIVYQSGIYPISSEEPANLTVSTMTLLRAMSNKHKFLEYLELVKEIHLSL